MVLLYHVLDEADTLMSMSTKSELSDLDISVSVYHQHRISIASAS